MSIFFGKQSSVALVVFSAFGQSVFSFRAIREWKTLPNSLETCEYIHISSHKAKKKRLFTNQCNAVIIEEGLLVCFCTFLMKHVGNWWSFNFAFMFNRFISVIFDFTCPGTTNENQPVFCVFSHK